MCRMDSKSPDLIGTRGLAELASISFLVELLVDVLVDVIVINS
jgi:hypothetical protein